MAKAAIKISLEQKYYAAICCLKKGGAISLFSTSQTTSNHQFYVMGQELKMQIPSNQTTINTNNLGELIWWCAHLGVGPEKLLSVIEKVGNSLEKVSAYIHKPR